MEGMAKGTESRTGVPEKTRKEELYILIGGAVLLVAVIVVGIVSGGGTRGGPSGTNETGMNATSTMTPQEELQNTGYTPSVPQNAVETPAQTTVQVVTDPTKDESLGIYHVIASRNGYNPSQLVVVQGNIVQLTFTSQGGQYDLSIPAMGVYITSPDGVDKHTSFRVPQSGTFKMACQDYCPSGGLEGTLVVKPKS